MKKKVLIIGNGAKEYALSKKMSECAEVYVTPASDTLKEFVHCLDIRPDSVNELLEFVLENEIDMTIPIAKEAIEADIATKFACNKQAVFSPSTAANALVSNKISAKKILYKLRIPTSKFGIFEKANMAIDYVKNQRIPFVIKTNDNNSAVVLTSVDVAKNIINNCTIDKNNKLIIEDYIYGTPFSFYAITDGYKALPFGSSITYKHSLEGNGGQLTSGMGACSPNYKLSIEHEYYIMDNVIYPTLEYLEREGNTYLGIIGVNGILTDDGEIKVLGWQNFMQDCDCMAVLNSIDENLYELFETCIVGSFSDEVEEIRFNNSSFVSIIAHCTNKTNNENVISGLESIDDNTQVVFYPTVRKNKYLEYEAECGAVLSLTAVGSTVGSAADKVYQDMEELNFKGLKYRKDICSVNYRI